MSDTDNKKLNWDDCIREAKERIKPLRESLNYFKAMKKAGEPFPVDFHKPEEGDFFRYVEL